MKYVKSIRSCLLILSVMIAALGQTVFAAGDEYTYTVRVCRQSGSGFREGNHDT